MKFAVLLVVFKLLTVEITAQRSFPAQLLTNITGSSDLFYKPIARVLLSINENNKPLLRWQSTAGKEYFYTIERSGNGTDYDVIGVLKGATSTDSYLEFTDDAPLRGKIYYRVKIATEKTLFISEAVSVVVSDDISCKFYPNPVDKMLIVRSELPVDIQVNDSFGKPLIITRLEAGLRVMDVSALPPGVYIITLQQKDNSKQITERLVKK
jgi:hypothetical protein